MDKPAKKIAVSKAWRDYFKKTGAVGGKTRAAKLTPEQRSQIAKRAAEKRWGEKDDGER